MNITDTVDALHEVTSKGRILIKPLNLDSLTQINLMPLWESTSILLAYNRQQVFGNSRWLAKKSKDSSVSIDTGSVLMDAEIKACLLLQYQIGFMLGEYGAGWGTCVLSARNLNRFAKYLCIRGINSLRELDRLPELWLRNIIRNFVAAPTEEGGLNYPASMAARIPFERAIIVAANYGLITKSHVVDLIADALDASEGGFVRQVLSHPIIPNDYLKTLIQQTGDDIKEAELVIEEWEEANNKLINAINQSTRKSTRKVRKYAIGAFLNAFIGLKKADSQHEISTEMNVLYERLIKLNTPFKGLRLSVITQLLLFSGMRVGEAQATKVDCAYKDTKTGRYYVKTVLTKTDDGEITLDWVINEDAYKAVTVLSRYVKGMQERAEAVLNKYSLHLTDDALHNIEEGLEGNLLFGVSSTPASVFFTRGTLSRDNNKPASSLSKLKTPFNLNNFKIPLTKRDVIQLESMECNYRSLIGDKRGMPYKVGDYFNLTAHQFRHTFAWFIIANRLGDLDDIKYQFKHLASAMTMVYANRGYESIDELFNLTESFDDMMSTRLAEEIVNLAKQGKLAGGGGRRLINGVENLLLDISISANDDAIPVEQRQIHFKSMSAFEQFMKKNFMGSRGLPHGICTKGSECKIKNSPDPSGCVFCPTYVASERNLPAWQVIERRFNQQLGAYDVMPPEMQREYEAMASSWMDERDAARIVIAQIKGEQQRGEE